MNVGRILLVYHQDQELYSFPFGPWHL
jgi:hypothetical protein